MRAKRLLLLACWGAAFVVGPASAFLVAASSAPRERGSLVFLLSLACVYVAVPVLVILRYEGPAGILASGLGVVATLFLGVMMLVWWRAMSPAVATLTVANALAHLLLVPCGVAVALHREPPVALHLKEARQEAARQKQGAVLPESAASD